MQQPRTGTENDSAQAAGPGRGSAWAEFDDTFFQLVDDAFSDVFSEGAAVLLASNDDPKAHADELAAAMRRHPSSRRRF